MKFVTRLMQKQMPLTLWKAPRIIKVTVRATGHKTLGESSEIRIRLLEESFTLYTSLSVRVSRIGAKLACLSITS